MTFEGYFHILHHMAVNRQDTADPDDVMDAILDIHAELNAPNPTDEDLEDAMLDFYIMQVDYDNAYFSIT